MPWTGGRCGTHLFLRAGLRGGCGGTDSGSREVEQAWRFRSAVALFARDFGGERRDRLFRIQSGGFVNVQAIVHFALAGDYVAILRTQLFECGDAEGLPEKVAIIDRQRTIIHGIEHDEGCQVGKVKILVGERESCADWTGERLGRVFDKCAKVGGREVPEVSGGPKIDINDGDSRRYLHGEV